MLYSLIDSKQRKQTMNRKTITFTAIPEWTLPAVPGALSFFETIALADLEDKWIRLSAATQKAILGANVFGKQEIKVTADGEVIVSRSTCFGMDHETAAYDLYTIKRAILRRARLSPGVSGGAYLSLGAEAMIDALRTAGADDQAKDLAAGKQWHELAKLIASLRDGRGTNWPDMTRAAEIMIAA